MLELYQGIRQLAEHPNYLGRDLLLEHLGKQRWFGGKARRPIGAVLTEPLYWEAADAVHALVDVQYADGDRERYYLPLVFRLGEDSPRAEAHSRVIAANGPGGSGFVCDAAGDPRFAIALYCLLRQGGGCTGASASVAGQVLQRLEVDFQPGDATLLVGEQSNTNWRLGNDFLLKIYRRVVEGPNPDVEVGRFLFEHGEKHLTPALNGFIEYRAAGREAATLAALHDWVEHQGDGWTEALVEVAGYYQRVRQQGLAAALLPQLDGDAAQVAETFPPPAELIGSYLETASALGRTTADLHRALAASDRDPGTPPAFAPEPLTAGDLEKSAASIRERAQRLAAELRRQLPSLPESARLLAERMLQQLPLPPRLIPRLDPTERLVRIRVHGDYHLGQVLRTPKGFVVVDFEGEPARPLAQRRSKYSPLKDVAGMVRSFSYAAHAGLRDYLTADPDARSQLGPWATVWQAWTSAAFLQAYRSRAAATFLPRDAHRFQAMLNLYLLDKALYELEYEMNNRPDWVEIPLHAVCGLLGGAHR